VMKHLLNAVYCVAMVMLFRRLGEDVT